MAEYMAGCQRGADEVGGKFPWDNIYHGLTVCSQDEADAKIPIFLQVPGKKFLSVEPMLGAMDFRKVKGFNRVGMDLSDWSVLCGAETGPGARPVDPDWVRSIRDQCQSAGVPFFLKHISKKDGRILDGRTHDDLPWRS